MFHLNKKFIIFFLIIALSLFFNRLSFAALELELTQGVSSGIPIAILPFNVANSEDSCAQTLNTVIPNDLKNSGSFRLVDATSQNSDNNAVNYDYWQSQKVENLVKGTIIKSGNQYQVSFELYDIYRKTLLLNQNYTIPSSEARKLSHHISDLIYEKLIGARGIFSTKIAYILVKNAKTKNPKYFLEVADQDGFNPRTLLTSPDPIMSPAWSPDGKTLAYVSFEGNRATIFSQNVATGSRKIMTKYPGINGAPAFSPDGSKAAIVLTKTGDPKIYILDLQSNALQQITTGFSLDTEPAFTPDGRSLIFTSNRSGGPQIYKIDLQSSNVTRLTYQGNYNARGSISQDGKTLVMLHQDENSFCIATQDLSTGHFTILTRSDFDESPNLAPNGNMIAYATTDQNGQGVLAEVSIDGHIKLFLPTREGNVQEPAWGPFNN